MKKYTFCIMAVVLVLAFALGAHAATIMVDPASQSVTKAGETFAINVKAADITDLFGYEFKLAFDKVILRFTKIEGGGFLGSDGATTASFLTFGGQMVYFKDVNPDILDKINSEGLLSVAGVRLGAAKGISGTGALVKVTFEVLQVKAGTLELKDVKMADSNAQLFAVDIKNGAIEAPPAGLKGDVNKDGAIKSADAILVLQFSAGLKTPDDYQKWAADINEDGQVNSRDAIVILRRAAGLAAPGADIAAKSSGQVTIAFAEAHGVAGESIIVPLEADNTHVLAGGDISIQYDQKVLRAVDVSSDPSVLLASNIREPGLVRIAFAGINGINSKAIAGIRFDIITDNISPLTFKMVNLYNPEGNPLIFRTMDMEFRSWAVPPERSELLQNYPNPFNPETWIPYQLKEPNEVTIRLYNTAGELVRQFDLGYKPAGLYVSRDRAVYWDGRDKFGTQVASGVYFYSIRSGDFVAVRKLVVLK